VNFTPPSIDYFAISPMIVIFGAAIVSVLVEAFAPRSVRRFLQLLIVFGALIASFVLIVLNVDTRVVTAGGSVVIDGPALLFQGSILILAILGVGLMAERSIDPVGDAFAARVSALPGSEEEKQFTQRGYLQTEIWPLTLFAVLGMLLFVSANDLLLMFVALEYLMTGMARRRRLISQEAALKYFLLGVFASAFFLYGAALVYGYSGSINFTEIAQTISSKPSESIILLIGIGMLMVGPLFKIGAVPFHQWVPDVYQGAPTAVVGFMAATVKIAAFGALLRLLYVAFGGVRWDWEPIIWIVASASMILGSILALVQTDIKRLLGYSWIAQAGFILVGLAAASPAGLTSTKFYVISYGFATVGTFAVVSMVRDPNGEATNLANWAGLGRKSPIVAMALSIFLLGLAGIPLTSGFVSKFLVFIAAVEAGATWLVIIGVVASLIAAFFYVRVIVIMFFAKPTEQTAVVAVPSAFTTVALAASVAVTVILGVVPQPVLELLTNADVFIR
jgi:NADH-quinone oxidoreductase subunit N